MLCLRFILILFTALVCVSPHCYAQTGGIASVHPQQQAADSQATHAIEKLLEETRKAFVAKRRSGMYVEARESVENGIRGLSVIKTKYGSSETLASAEDTVTFYLCMLDAIEADVDSLEKRLLDRPNDLDAVLVYGVKIQLIDDELYEADPRKKSRERLAHYVEVLAKVRALSADKAVQVEVDNLIGRVNEYLLPRLEEAEKRREIIGMQIDKESFRNGVWLNDELGGSFDIDGKLVLVDFCALWCGPCIASLPEIDELHKKHFHDGLVVVAAIRREDDPAQEEQVARLFKTKNFVMPCFIDSGALFDYCHVSKVPQYVLIGRDRRVIDVLTGNASARSLKSKVIEILQLDVAKTP